MSLSKDLSHAYCVRSSVHLATASTMEAQTAERAKSLSKAESCDRKPVIDLLAGILFTWQLKQELPYKKSLDPKISTGRAAVLD